MTNERITRACEILDYAINNNCSAKNASKKLGFGKNYVSDVKRTFEIQNADITLGEQLFLKKYDKYLNTKNNIINDTKQIVRDSVSNSLLNFPESVISNKITVKENDDTISVVDDGNEKTIEWSGNNYSSDHIKTLEDLLIATKTDKEYWNVKSHVINKWDTTFVDANKNPRTIQNFQVKAILEKNISHQNNVNASDEFVKMIENYSAPILYVPMTELSEENNLLEINLPDLHLGKLCWAGETGENYDVKIATERFISALNSLLYKATNFKFERILFPIGNDFFNVDNIGNTTTAGTPQDEDLRWQKTYNIGVKLLVDAINLLKQTGVPVDVMIIQGNHDVTRSYFMGSYLSAWFREDKQVTINNGASPRKYYKYGKVLLGFTHGSEEKEGSLPMLMATDIESKPMWSNSIFHEFHLGHQHRKKGFKYTVNRDTIYNEELGVTVRYISSLSSSDSWHHRNGYIGSHKAGEAFIWNADEGLMAHLNVNIILND